MNNKYLLCEAELILCEGKVSKETVIQVKKLLKEASVRRKVLMKHLDNSFQKMVPSMYWQYYEYMDTVNIMWDYREYMVRSQLYQHHFEEWSEILNDALKSTASNRNNVIKATDSLIEVVVPLIQLVDGDEYLSKGGRLPMSLTKPKKLIDRDYRHYPNIQKTLKRIPAAKYADMMVNPGYWKGESNKAIGNILIQSQVAYFKQKEVGGNYFLNWADYYIALTGNFRTAVGNSNRL
jgi:hypothetical protein